MEVLYSLWAAFLSYLPKLISAALTFIVGYIIIKIIQSLIKKWMEKHVHVSFHVFIQSCTRIFMWIFLLLCVAGSLGIDTSSFVTTLGAAGLAIGLALQNSLSNLASGLMILATRTFQVGDFIEINGVSGTVQRIDLMFSCIDTPDNKQITIPNSTLTSGIVINYTKNDIRRVDLTYSISYDSSIEQAKSILKGLCAKNPLALEDPAPVVVVSAHGDSAVMIAVRIWCKKENYWDVTFAMNEQVKLAFDEAGISIPFPQVDVHTK